MQFYGISLMHAHRQSRRWQEVLHTHETTSVRTTATEWKLNCNNNNNNNTIKLHVQVFLTMNTWMSEICLRQ
jgi:hypothetical protein